MKKYLLIITFLVINAIAFPQTSPKLKIIYFHMAERCATCYSIEENTQKTLETYFGKQFKDGEITFQSLDLSDEANNELVEKLEADGSSLYLVKVSDSKEYATDLTTFAFKYSLRKPKKFIEGLKAEIEEKL
jgi:hypothetical protein